MSNVEALRPDGGSLHPNVAGVQVRVIAFAESTRTAVEAAAAIGTSVAQIAKSLVFLAGE